MGIHDASTWESTQCMWPSNPPRYGSPLDMRGPPRRLAMDSHADYVAVQQYAVVKTMPLWASIPVHNPNAWLSTRVCGPPREELRGCPPVCVAAQCCRALAVHTRPRLATRGISWVRLEGRGHPQQGAWTQSGRAICLAWASIPRHFGRPSAIT